MHISKYLLLLTIHTVYKFQCHGLCVGKHIFWKYLEEESRCIFNFLRKKNQFSKLFVSSYIFMGLPYPLQYLVFLIWAIIMGRGDILYGLNLHFSGDYWCCGYSLAMYVSSSVKSPFKYFHHFGLFVSLLWVGRDFFEIVGKYTSH